MKKVLFILPLLNSGGAERVAINYIRQINDNEYNIKLVVFKKTDDLLPLMPNNVALIDLKTNSTKFSFMPLMKVIKDFKPNIVFTTHSRISTLLMFVKLFVPKFKHIARMQSMPSLEKKNNEYGFLKRTLYSFGFKSADLVIAQTKAMKDDAVDTFNINEKKIEVLPNPLDKFYINQMIKDELSIFSNKDINAVASGRIRFERGFDILLKSVFKIVQEFPNFKLYILGDDRGDLGKLKKQRDELNLNDHVIFEGFQRNPYKYYKNCDLFVLSSRWEGFPNAMIENYYLNTPIVATKCVPVISELVVDGVNGYKCEIEDSNELYIAIKKCIINIPRVKVSNNDYIGSNLGDYL